MPRKTIASLEAEIAELTAENASHVEDVEALKTQLAYHQRDPNTYLSFVPTGDPELDALQVAGRAIESLRDPAQRERCTSYLAMRFIPEPAEDAAP